MPLQEARDRWMRPFRSARQAALVLWLVVAPGCRWMRPDPSYSYDALRRLQDRGVDEARAALDGYAGPAPAGPLRAPGL